MNISCVNERLSSTESIVLSLWFASSGLAAVIGNAAVLCLFYKNESLRTISNRFLSSLCAADVTVGLVIDPTWIVIRCWIQPPRTHTLRQVINLFWIHTTAATVFNLCCVSVDRFIAIRFPFRYQDVITKKRCYAVILMVWLISLFLPFSRILVDKRTNIEKLWFSLTFITFVLPLSVVSLCYFWIFQIARKQSRRIKRENIQNPQENSATVAAIQNHKGIKTIGFVLGVFIVSWMPSLVVSVVDFVTAGDKCVDHRLAYVVWPWLEAIAFTSSAINPWIYCFRNREFRETLRLNLHLCPCLHSRTSPESTIGSHRHRRVQIVNGSPAFQLRQSTLGSETEHCGRFK